jgi:hypothetical protein
MVLSGCGGNEGLTVKNPWDPDYAQYFDDSIDFTMNPESLSGQWLYDYQLELESRVSLSDYILAVRVDSINLKSDAAGKQWKNLGVNVEKKVKGEFPAKSVVLTVADDQPGFDSFQTDDGRLTDKVYLAFLRLYETETGDVGIHWHISPLSEGLMQGMNDILEEQKPKKKTDEKVYTLEAE